MPTQTHVWGDHCERDLTAILGGGILLMMEPEAVWATGRTKLNDMREPPFGGALHFCPFACVFDDVVVALPVGADQYRPA